MDFITFDIDEPLKYYNTYVTSVEFETLGEFYIGKELKDFYNLPTETKNLYLQNASLYLDDKYKFIGDKLNIYQSMQFPRINLVDNIDNGIIPINIQRVVVLLALKLYDEVNNPKDIDIKREKIGRTLEREYFNINEVDIIARGDNNVLDKFIKIYIKQYLIFDLRACRT